jgi:hypothetical protein
MQWKRENFYLYGLVEPLTGEYFIWEFSHLNAAYFSVFLEKFLEYLPLNRLQVKAYFGNSLMLILNVTNNFSMNLPPVILTA